MFIWKGWNESGDNIKLCLPNLDCEAGKQTYTAWDRDQ